MLILRTYSVNESKTPFGVHLTSVQFKSDILTWLLLFFSQEVKQQINRSCKPLWPHYVIKIPQSLCSSDIHRSLCLIYWGFPLCIHTEGTISLHCEQHIVVRLGPKEFSGPHSSAACCMRGKWDRAGGNFKEVDLSRNINILKQQDVVKHFYSPHRGLEPNVAEAWDSLLSDSIKCCCEPCLPFTFEEVLQVRPGSLKAINEKWVRM